MSQSLDLVCDIVGTTVVASKAAASQVSDIIITQFIFNSPKIVHAVEQHRIKNYI